MMSNAKMKPNANKQENLDVYRIIMCRINVLITPRQVFS